MKKNLIIFAVLSCFLALTFSCASKKKDQIHPNITNPNVLKVGVTPDSAPIIYKKNNKITGLEAELCLKFAKYIGKEVKFIEVKWQNQIPALLEKKTDLIASGMTATKTRDYKIAFALPYLKIGQIALVRKKDTYSFPKGYYGILSQSIILKFGVIKGTTGESYTRNNFKNAKKIIAYDTPKQALTALIKGKIDLFIYDSPDAYALMADYDPRDIEPLPTLLTEEYLSWGVRKEDKNLLNSANEFISKLKKNGELVKIINKWIPEYTE